MVLPFLLPAAAAFVGRMIGKSGADAEAEEKLDLVKKLANLTPEQAQAVDAIKKQPIKEVRIRAELGIGPFSPLPAQASERAQAIRQARIDAASGTDITPEERAQIDAAPDKKAAMDALVNRKTSEMVAAIQARVP